MTPKDPLANIPSWMDPAQAIAAFGSYRDMASYNRIMRGGDDLPVFDPSADAAYGYIPEASIHTDYGDRGSGAIDFSSPGRTNAPVRQGNNAGGPVGNYAILRSSAGHYVYEAAPKSSAGETDNTQNQNQGQNQSYTYSSFSFTLDAQGNPSFTGPKDTEHSDGKWKIQEICAKLSDSDYTRFKKSINDARATRGLSKLYNDV